MLRTICEGWVFNGPWAPFFPFPYFFFFFLHFQCGNLPFLCSWAWLEGQVIVVTWSAEMQDRNEHLQKLWPIYCSFNRLAVHRQWSMANKHEMLEFILYSTCKSVPWTASYVFYERYSVSINLPSVILSVYEVQVRRTWWWSRYKSGFPNHVELDGN